MQFQFHNSTPGQVENLRDEAESAEQALTQLKDAMEDIKWERGGDLLSMFVACVDDMETAIKEQREHIEGLEDDARPIRDAAHTDTTYIAGVV